MTTFACDFYAIDIEDGMVADVFSYIADDAIRARIVNRYADREPDVPVRLSVTHCDILLDALSRWEGDSQEG